MDSTTTLKTSIGNGDAGIIGKDRVNKNGEVFTPDSIVNDMIDLVDKELKSSWIPSDSVEKAVWSCVNNAPSEDTAWEYLDKTWLEPACGTGNFLIRILDRKLAVMQNSLPRDKWNLALIHSLASIYGVDIMQDNINESISRIQNLIKNGGVSTLKLATAEEIGWHFIPWAEVNEVDDLIKFVLTKNIQRGNTLSGKCVVGIDDASKEEGEMQMTEYVWDPDRENITLSEMDFNNLIQENNINYGIKNSTHERVHYTKMNSLSAKSANEHSVDVDNYDF